MARDYSRRDFLKVSGMGVAAAVATKAVAELPFGAGDGAAAPAPRGAISVCATSDKLRQAQGTPLAWQPAAGAAPPDAIAIDPGKKFQKVLGFGAAFTDAACYTFNRLTAGERDSLFHQLFHPQEMGLNVCRTCIGSSDYSRRVYSYDEGPPDPDLKRFSIDYDRAYILPMLHQARKVNPDLFLFSSPWSPPGWMKANGSMLGGSMRRQYMPSYAHYFLKFLEGYEAEGVPVQAVTVQNEVDTDQDGRMPACIWPQEYEADFVRLHLGPLLARRRPGTAIWLIDHNYSLWGRALDELEMPDVRQYAHAIAWHGYAGEPEWMMRVQERHPDVEMYWTEGGPDYPDPHYATDWAQWSQTFSGILRNGCRSITGWNLALDERGRPNIGPFSCGGLVTIHSQTRAISYSGQFWALGHFARFVRRGARRLDSQSSAAQLDHVAFENPDGTRVLVVTNRGAGRGVQLRLGGAAAAASLEANSVTTFRWQ